MLFFRVPSVRSFCSMLGSANKAGRRRGGDGGDGGGGGGGSGGGLWFVVELFGRSATAKLIGLVRVVRAVRAVRVALTLDRRHLASFECDLTPN